MTTAIKKIKIKKSLKHSWKVTHSLETPNGAVMLWLPNSLNQVSHRNQFCLANTNSGDRTNYHNSFHLEKKQKRENLARDKKRPLLLPHSCDWSWCSRACDSTWPKNYRFAVIEHVLSPAAPRISTFWPLLLLRLRVCGFLKVNAKVIFFSS